MNCFRLSELDQRQDTSPRRVFLSSVAALLLVSSVLLAAQGCCPKGESSTPQGASDVCGEVTSATGSHAAPQAPAKGFRASHFGGPYPCQETRKKLNNFGIYQRMGLNDLVDVRPLDLREFVESINSNKDHNKRRFQRYNYVIDHKGTIRVAVWTETAKTSAFLKSSKQDVVPGRMIDFDGEEPFEVDGQKTKATHWIVTPSGEGGKKVGIRDALSKHYRLAQPAKWRSKFVAEKWNGTTVAYAGEIIVDTAPEDIPQRIGKCPPTNCYFYLNNGSGTYKPDGHYLREVATYFAGTLGVAPRFVYQFKSDAWEFETETKSLIDLCAEMPKAATAH
ncbi:hypothetical protein GC176_02715 [bacterium]|nr:hypothetical protein [bacterium]